MYITDNLSDSQIADFSRARASFLSGLSIDTSIVPAKLLNSWQMSLASGVDPYMKTLPPPSLQLVRDILQEGTDSSAQRILSYGRRLEYQWLSHLNSLFENIHAVYMSVTATQIVLRAGGDSDLLNLLARRNIGTGTDFSAHKIGSNSVSLSLQTQTPCAFFGPEHFADVFQDLVCYAFPTTPNIHLGVLLLVTTLDNYNETCKYIFSTISALHDVHIKEQSDSISVLQRENGLKTTKLHNDLIRTNENGFIFFISSYLLDVFELDLHEVIGQYLGDVIPELSRFLARMDKPRSSQETVTFTLPDKTTLQMYVDYRPFLKGNQLLGMDLYLSNIAKVFSADTSSSAPALSASQRKKFYTMDSIIGSSPALSAAKNLAIQAAKSNSNVLLLGDSGTGKELFAQAIHTESSRARNPFVSINCSSIPRELIGSELFGYVEGAFTGARKGGSPGKFESANGGTLFLDEIGEMPLDVQSSLLRILEERMVVRIGSTRPILIDVRIIAATNKDLRKMVEEGSFRLDLFYRLNVLRIVVPPLRQRVEDIPELAAAFILRFNQTLNKNIKGISYEAVDLLSKHTWPGNIRELRNTIEYAANLCNTSVISIEHLPSEIIPSAPASQQSLTSAPSSELISQFSRSTQEQEKQLLDALILKYAGNKSRIAKELGVSRSTLYRKLKHFSIVL